jgi:uncharacterized integral membrane protein
MDISNNPETETLPVYQGYYGNFTITQEDCREVLIYRTGLAIAATCWALGTAVVLTQGNDGFSQTLLTLLFFIFCGAIGVSLSKIHIYLISLHRGLQAFWLLGTASAIAVSIAYPEPLLITIYEHPITLLGIGWLFVALTGIYFKEGFCFRRLETMVLTPLVPLLLLSHLVGALPLAIAQVGLGLWSGLFILFAARKFTQAPADDIGDKSVFAYLKQTIQT